MPKNTPNFTYEDEEKLVNLVSNYRAIYDASVSTYKDLIVRENIWKEIGKQMKRTGDDCKKKWRTIRDSYFRYKRKNKLPTGSAATNKSKWHLFESLRFLDQVSMERHTLSNIDGDGTPESIEGDSQEPNDADEISLEPSPNESPCTISEPGPSIIDESPRTTSESSLVPGPPKPKRSKRKTTNSDHEELFKTREERRQTERQELFRATEYDETIDSFGQHVKSVLSSLPNVMKNAARTEIYKLTKYETQAAMRTSTITPSSTPEFYHSTSMYSSESIPEPVDMSSMEAISTIATYSIQSTPTTTHVYTTL